MYAYASVGTDHIHGGEILCGDVYRTRRDAAACRSQDYQQGMLVGPIVKVPIPAVPRKRGRK